MKRRALLLSAAALPLLPAAAQASEAWGQAQDYPGGWGSPPNWAGHKSLRVGNYSGGYEKMFPWHNIAAPLHDSPLSVDLRDDLSYRWGLFSKTVPEYVKGLPVTGLLIARQGVILAEHHPFDRQPQMRLTSWSMAKSITSLLLGICLDRGLIRSLDDTAQSYVEELQGTLHGGITLRNLANMSSGAAILHDRDNPQIYPKAFLRKNSDLELTVKDWSLSEGPQGTRYNYNELCPLTVGMVIRRVTGKTLAAFCQEALWQPMGAEADASWLTDSKGREYNCIGFAARLRDWARLGQLVAQNGAMDGRQVVSARWINECASWSDKDSQVRHGTAMNGMGYKCFFWHPKADGSWMMMNGHHGQRVLIDRKTQTVMVQTAVDSEGPWQREFFELFAAATRLT
ncbi:serine hydrolase [Polaromonas sp. SM01]|uniref:serine hydrolase domain-containing protein n=1 Tax=Polaromonas sp. SM01 TaxID=3085630 RepID=UPI00298288AE|nr:serine hydrolase [Polaromonas sp. SM01]MDW5442366.1 serine hydrolase [Polaromonas sp. SM01]